MLTKRDLELIDELIKNRFQDFYENLFEPHVTQSAKEHKMILDEIRKINKRDNIQADVLRGHEGRITDLERKSF